MNADPSDPTERDARLDELIAEYLGEVEGGRNPNREQYLSRYPDLAVDLGAFLDDRDQFQRLVDPDTRTACPQCQGRTEPTADGRGCAHCGWFTAPDEVSDLFPVPYRLERFRLIKVVGCGAF